MTQIERRLVFVHGGSGPQLAALADPALQLYDPVPVHVRDLAGSPQLLDDADVLVVSDRLRPHLLEQSSEPILDVARRGGTLVVFAENGSESWLPGARGERRPTVFWWWRTGEDHGLRRNPAPHPAHELFPDRALVWHIHGVLTPPPGAVSLMDRVHPDGSLDGSVFYIDEASTPGRILATTMDPVYHHGSGFMPGATQLLYRALYWASRPAS